MKIIHWTGDADSSLCRYSVQWEAGEYTRIDQLESKLLELGIDYQPTKKDLAWNTSLGFRDGEVPGSIRLLALDTPI